MQRLTKRDKGGNACMDCANCETKYRESCCSLYYCRTNIIKRLAAYEDAEEQGRLVMLPCKVGDTVWDRKAEPWTVISIEWFSRKVTQLHCKSPVTGTGNTFSIGRRSLGKTVFLTREEAEAKLREVV